MSTVSLLPADVPSVTTLPVRPWPDGVIDALGHDPRSAYVERFWLGILGPSTTWLLRFLANALDASPEGFDLDLPATAQALGLGARGGRHSPFMRALSRCCQFDVAEARADGTLAVRRKLPPLNRRQILRLPSELAAAHQAWQESQLQTPAHEQQRRRARRLALSLLELGEDVEATENQLARWKFHPLLCRESVTWAAERHGQAGPHGDGNSAPEVSGGSAPT